MNFECYQGKANDVRAESRPRSLSTEKAVDNCCVGFHTTETSVDNDKAHLFSA